MSAPAKTRVRLPAPPEIARHQRRQLFLGRRAGVSQINKRFRTTPVTPSGGRGGVRGGQSHGDNHRRKHSQTEEEPPKNKALRVNY